MKAAEVRIGDRYIAKVSKKIVTVRIVDKSRYRNGWEAVNEATGRTIHIKTAARLRANTQPGE